MLRKKGLTPPYYRWVFLIFTAFLQNSGMGVREQIYPLDLKNQHLQSLAQSAMDSVQHTCLS